MALTTFSSSFTSSPSPTWGYEVFVSYNGDDTGKSFTDHDLFAALKRHEIRAFRDDKELERGKDIWTELEKAIETSRIAIIVFSINYAASSWCLNELAKILECRRSLQQIVLPIFYNVEPSKLRALKGNLAQVFASHVERFGEGKVQRWRTALTEAANLAGWDSGNDAHRSESKLIEKIIGDILIKLNLAYFTVTPYPVGVESRVQEINKHLDEYAGDVCMVGIWGMGGIGKTTIAQALYNLIKCKFEVSCFLENIRTRSEQSGGLIDLQEQIISSAQVNSKKKVRDVYEGISVIRDIIQSKKFLLVLDDVWGPDELRKLGIDKDYFQPGSIIIITSRAKHLLHGAGCDFIYESPFLDYNESFQLFSWHAFGKDHPNENYVVLTNEVVYYAQGLPLN
ncbi:disease resistance protein RPV1-like [Quercus robur]|uniref:disease resistance protein RPV1-like n=1 Tax=Quercus robur TaxID=38942 RepID=UPI002163F592|nr:disease resistance protein RPV1-like [Quercus robur]